MNWPEDFPTLPPEECVVLRDGEKVTQEPGTYRLLRSLAAHPINRWLELTPMSLRITNENFRVSLHRLRGYGWKIERMEVDPDYLRLDPSQAIEIREWFIEHWSEPGVRETALRFGFASL